MLVTFGICFKQHFDTRYLVFYNPSPHRMFLSLDLLSEYRIQHGASDPFMSHLATQLGYSAGGGGVSGFATDCPCDVWCRGLSACLLHVGPTFGNRFLNTSWAVGLTYWVVYFHFCYFNICNYICLDTSYHFWLYLYFSNILYFFKYSCTNIFHRRSLCTFYYIEHRRYHQVMWIEHIEHRFASSDRERQQANNGDTNHETFYPSISNIKDLISRANCCQILFKLTWQ